LIEQRAQQRRHGLRWLSGAEARALEPALAGEAALLSTVTGIIDSHALMLASSATSRAPAVRSCCARRSSARSRDDGFVLRSAAPLRSRSRPACWSTPRG
jgi:L-2-hydroxyglutarate oxidase LhgO